MVFSTRPISKNTTGDCSEAKFGVAVMDELLQPGSMRNERSGSIRRRWAD